MGNVVFENKSKSAVNGSLENGQLDVNINYYDGDKCDFSLTAKNVGNGLPVVLAKMFSTYFACLMLHPSKSAPKISEDTIEYLKPFALAVFKEIGRLDMKSEKEGEELLEKWTNQFFRLMQSGHGIH